MFKHITIHLRGPICNCNEAHLSWSTPDGCLALSCTVCKVRLIVPHDQFQAVVNFEIPYPDKQPKEVPKLKSVDGGKVLPIKTPDDDELEHDS